MQRRDRCQVLRAALRTPGFGDEVGEIGSARRLEQVDVAVGIVHGDATDLEVLLVVDPLFEVGLHEEPRAPERGLEAPEPGAGDPPCVADYAGLG